MLASFRATRYDVRAISSHTPVALRYSHSFADRLSCNLRHSLNELGSLIKEAKMGHRNVIPSVKHSSSSTNIRGKTLDDYNKQILKGKA